MNHNHKLIALAMVALFLTSYTFAQDSPKWNQAGTWAHVAGSYTELPGKQKINPTQNTTTKKYHTENGNFLVAGNIRVLPNTITQSEENMVNMGGNQNQFMAEWNSYATTGTFYGTGFAVTTNGGSAWTGSSTNMNPSNNDGDPAPWIWPTGSTWAGWLGTAVISGTAGGILSFYSSNLGTSWSTPVTIENSGSEDKELACVDDVSGSPFLGRSYCYWTDFAATGYPIHGAYSSNGGTSWSTPIAVSPAPAGSNFTQGTDCCVGPGGVVYVVWAYNISNGQNSTEVGLGFAKSTNGGVSYVSATNTAVATNGIRTQSLYNGIRSNGFPRISVDKSGGSRNGWIYACMSEKSGGSGPARDVADVCLMRSTDGGTTWTHTIVNQDASGNYNYVEGVTCDNSGNVAVSYYDTRGLSVPLTQFYMSYSANGGSSWTDVLVSDHTFTPTPISGLATGYQGDYSGITWSNGKFWPAWCDNSAGVYQVWTVGVPPPVTYTHDYASIQFLHFPQGNQLINVAENIVGEIQNQGTSNETNVPIAFVVNGTVTNTTNKSENAAQIDSVSNTWTPPTAGPYTLKYICQLSTDQNRSNDTITGSVTVVSSLPPLCEQFEEGTFPPSGWAIAGAGAAYWLYGAYSGYGVGAHSAEYNMWTAPAGDDATLTSLTFAPLSNTGQVIFDIAYSPYPASPPYSQDSLVVLYSTNGGGSYVSLARLGPTQMQTTAASNSEFVPSASTWAHLTYSLPTGTNKLQFLGRSQYGDDVYIDSICVSTLVGIRQINSSVPDAYSLSQNYPNPFNPTTNIEFGLPKSGQVKLVVFDILGREVKTIVNEYREAGSYKVDFDASNLASGVYFYRIDAANFTQVKKMLLIK